MGTIAGASLDKWKEYITSYGKEINALVRIGIATDPTNPTELTYTTFQAENIVSINPHFDGALYSSVMKELDVELMGEHSLKGGIVSLPRIGTSANGSSFVYAYFGDYIVKDCEYDVANNSTKCVCYDKMLEAMIPYDITFEYPLTVGAFLQGICDRFEWTLATPTFCNSDVEIEEEKFDESYTFRDVLDQIAQVSGGIIGFKASQNDKKLYVMYPTDTGEIIDESNLKNLKIGEKYGPVNSLVLARTPQEDNIYAQDTESIEANGLCEVKFENNQIMDSHRDDFIENLLNQIKGTTYYLYELESYGIGYLNLGDMFTIQTEDGTMYPVMMLNDDLQVTQGMNEKSSLSKPEETETDYKTASKTDRLLNQTMLKVDKQDGKIEALVTRIETVEEYDGRIQEVEKSVKQIVTAEYVETLVSEKVSGIDEVQTTAGRFDKDGLKISKSGSDTTTLIDDDGVDVSANGEKVLVADSTGVNALNLTARQYLIAGTVSRFEDYDNGSGKKRTGCFVIGG